MHVRQRLLLLAPVLALGLLPVACGNEAAPAAGPSAGSSNEAVAGFPVTIDNCGAKVTFERPPERVILLESAPVTIFKGLGVLDKVVLRAGAFPPAYFDDETNTFIEKIESLGEDLDSSGHLKLSQETVIAKEPDLVMGLPDGFTREGLAASGINALMQPVYCPEGKPGATTFDDIYEQVQTYGKIFGRPKEAAAMVATLKERVTKATMQPSGKKRTAAVLFPTVGGGSGYAYGNKSMSHPQLEAAGFTNVFGDVNERVFEVTLESIIDRDPDVLVLLYVDGDPKAVKDAIVKLPGANDLRAVKNDAILVQLFNFTEPPTPLSVDGLERIEQHFGSGT